jgi:hypothetical protein
MEKSYGHNPFESLGNTLRREARKELFEHIKDTGNRVVEYIGHNFRDLLALPESPYRDTNRRAGRTAIAIGLVTLSGLGFLASKAEVPECKTFYLSEMPTQDANIEASEIVTSLDATEISDAFDNFRAGLNEEGKVNVCGKKQIDTIEQDNLARQQRIREEMLLGQEPGS